MYTMNEFYNDVDAFNYLKGWNEKMDSRPSNIRMLIGDQLNLIDEELSEACEAWDNMDDKEILKESIDIIVTSLGLIQLLDRAGVDVGSALEAVALNNLAKFYESVDKANETCEYYSTEGEEAEVKEVYEDDDGVVYAVIRKSDGKLLKPQNHPKVDLSEYLKTEN